MSVWRQVAIERDLHGRGINEAALVNLRLKWHPSNLHTDEGTQVSATPIRIERHTQLQLDDRLVLTHRQLGDGLGFSRGVGLRQEARKHLRRCHQHRARRSRRLRVGGGLLGQGRFDHVIRDKEQPEGEVCACWVHETDGHASRGPSGYLVGLRADAACGVHLPCHQGPEPRVVVHVRARGDQQWNPLPQRRIDLDTIDQSSRVATISFAAWIEYDEKLSVAFIAVRNVYWHLIDDAKVAVVATRKFRGAGEVARIFVVGKMGAVHIHLRVGLAGKRRDATI